jgi:hypothetical protein
MLFDVAGPFVIPRFGKKKNITKESLKQVREQMEHHASGLSEACGCYVFAKRAGQGITPWYIGQACKSPMLAEALNPANMAKYNRILDDDQGTPVLFAIPAKTPGGRFRQRPANGKLASLSFLERWLIAAAIEKNPDLVNSKETKFLRDLHVVGVFNAKKGESTDASQKLTRALGI